MPYVGQQLGKSLRTCPKDTNPDAEENEDKDRLWSFCIFYHIYDFINQQMSLIVVLIFFACVKDKTNPFEWFDFLFSLQVVTAENGRYQRHLIKILSENIMVFIVVDNHIDNSHPAMQSFRRADKEIIFVKDFKHIIF